MDDKTCRLEILRELKKAYDKDAYGLVQKSDFLAALGVEENVVDRNVKYLEEKGLVKAQWHSNGGFYAWINAHGVDFLETGQPSGLAILSPVSIHQEFHGSVGAVAGRDVKVQISFNEVLNKLAETVEADQKIPLEEKRSLIERLKSLTQNEWIRSIGTSVLADVIKKSAGVS